MYLHTTSHRCTACKTHYKYQSPNHHSILWNNGPNRYHLLANDFILLSSLSQKRDSMPHFLYWTTKYAIRISYTSDRFVINVEVIVIKQMMEVTGRQFRLNKWFHHSRYLVQFSWKYVLSDEYPNLQVGLYMRRECRDRFPRCCMLAIPAYIMARVWCTCRDAYRHH